MSPKVVVGPDLARSWLLVNAFQPERFEKAAASAADVVLLDVEDAVAPDNKEQARSNVSEYLGAGNKAWARINGFGTPWWADDCSELGKHQGLEGVMLAMVESHEHIERTAALLPGVKIVALVETARGVENLTSIARTKGLFRLGFGLGDFRRDTGFSDDSTVLAYTRSQFTIASRSAGLPGPIDGPAVGAVGVALADAAGVTAAFGMTGKICLMPEQCATVNEILSPSIGDMSWALDFLSEFQSEGGTIRNGSDLPRLARAKKILGLAERFGLDMPEGYEDAYPAPSDTYHF
ncbi:HpcH/HpaI aldolase/citrate lyase family protein [Propionibacteriaceae bacterium G57]|uniref:HpcH/HpaI aldolase/citrate lyase family protein n=1 Tax=Aestuariimicrobium sp. G57 TaxID=3418485 RepID=UPI003DA75DE4